VAIGLMPDFSLSGRVSQVMPIGGISSRGRPPPLVCQQ